MSETVIPASPRRSGRPRTPRIDEERIASAALELIDERGWQGCTMAALAARLGVRAPSLYHHISGQEQIVDLVRPLVIAHIIDPSESGLEWREAFFAFGVSYYRAFAHHPNTIQVLSTTPVHDAATLRMYEGFLRMMHGAGWDLERAYEAMIGLEHLALGFAYEWNAEELMLDSALAAEHGAPLLAEITRDRTEQPVIAEETFLSLLRRYIDMFAMQLDRNER
ncbi:TetR/AcrR family transcriptional regulator C-terminal domain-containing protein [Leucobacter sp. CSA2]|uniref:TetR/AcrR family transcriptional regulator C-terminal domain-containing protein n=1 Tax=Leucobacter edaphi TaxID=2796472 RepID=A0A934UXK1_9MICO|nr:TetR/AcrR family transcriptional regulator C-terminal domain-containing protein [Leucobacter edaphi]